MTVVKKNLFLTLFLVILNIYNAPIFAQKGYSFQIVKPTEFRNRKLRSEKTNDIKFTLPVKIIQNTGTHFNYAFNADQLYKRVIEDAKKFFTDDFSQPFLSFYNYTLDGTAMGTQLIDSIVLKSQTGIAVHDLRNKWIDDLYLLWGNGYYLQKKFDSAYLMYQFINYSFNAKDKNGQPKTIGSSRAGNNIFSISSKEKKGAFGTRYSRNDAFLAQIRNFLAQTKLDEANSLIVSLKADPHFPKRLKHSLNELTAHFYYLQQNWDSSAAYLKKSLKNAIDKNERSRWEYLLGQMYEYKKDGKNATKFYSAAIKHTTNRLLEIHARIAAIRAIQGDSEQALEKNIAELRKLVKKDMFEDYLDILYYMIAQLELKRNNDDEALAMLIKSTQYNSGNGPQRNRAFLQIADFLYTKKMYQQSYTYYDSINLADPNIKNGDEITLKKQSLRKIVEQIDIINRQDSLQKIAALPKDERDKIIRQILKDIQKKKELEEHKQQLADEKLATQANKKNTVWYFDDEEQKRRGRLSFRTVWGSRPNADNWRILDKLVKQGQAAPATNTGGTPNEATATFESIEAKLPSTTGLLKISNDSLINALTYLGAIYIQELADCESGTATLQRLIKQFSNSSKIPEALLNLYFCYKNNGETAKAEETKRTLNTNFPKSHQAETANTGRENITKRKDEAAKKYDEIYKLFEQGEYAAAAEMKKQADLIYGEHYWTPQLKYIEAVYFLKNNNDTSAIKNLQSIVAKEPGSDMAKRANTLINVVNRRGEIETELTNLQLPVEKPAETPPQQEIAPKQTDNISYTPKPRIDTIAAVIKPEIKKTDTIATKKQEIAKPVVEKPKTDTTIAQKPAKDSIAKAAPKDTIVKTIATKTDSANLKKPEIKDTAVAKTEKPKQETKDSTKIKPTPKTETAKPANPDSALIVKQNPKTTPDSFPKPPPPIAIAKKQIGEYVIDPEATHKVLVVLENVDPVFVDESKNAFGLYNKSKFRDKNLATRLVVINNTQKIVVIESFSNAAEAINYIKTTKPNTLKEIMPWFKGGSYSYVIASEQNLTKLLEKKNMEEYRNYINTGYPELK